MICKYKKTLIISSACPSVILYQNVHKNKILDFFNLKMSFLDNCFSQESYGLDYFRTGIYLFEDKYVFSNCENIFWCTWIIDNVLLKGILAWCVESLCGLVCLDTLLPGMILLSQWSILLRNSLGNMLLFSKW